MSDKAEPLTSVERVNTMYAEKEAALERPLTAQETQFVTYYSRGYTPAAAARAAGYSGAYGRTLAAHPRIAKVIARVKDGQANMIQEAVSVENLTNMLFESHRKSATATEEVTAIREIGRLNGLYDKSKETTVNIKISDARQLEGVPLEKVLEMAQIDVDTIHPTGHLIEGEAQAVDGD